MLLWRKALKDIICDVKNSQLVHDLLTSVNVRVILPFHEVFIFTKLRVKLRRREVLSAKFCENKILIMKISEFTVIAAITMMDTGSYELHMRT